MNTEKLFSYGTLQYESVQLSTFGRKLIGHADILKGFSLSFVEITDPHVIAASGEAAHPIITRTENPLDQVSGTVFDISPEELEQADSYEVDDYTRISVQLDSGVKAWVYVSKTANIDPNEKMKRVELTPPNSEWSRLFHEAAAEIKTMLGDHCIDIHHIGSTAIPNIYAKPIIDMLPVVKNLELIDAFNLQFEALGYVCMGEYGIAGRRFYWKSKMHRTHNVHLFEQGSPEILRHLAFRDFMQQHEHYAKAYSVLKCCLAEVFSDDIENYVKGKSSFVQMIDYQTGTAREKQLKAQDDIIIQVYNPAWPKLAEAEIKAIKTMTSYLPFVLIEHIGSTAVPELSSKPIIDIFISIPSIKEAKHWIAPLESLGYDYWNENPDKAHLRFFKGMPPFGEGRTHHVHIVEASNDTMEHRLLFRDILRQDKNVRSDYESLKLKLAQSHLTDRELYTEKKLAFIESTLRARGYTKPISR